MVTGLLYLDESAADMHELSNSTEVPMAHICPSRRCAPARRRWSKLQDEYR